MSVSCLQRLQVDDDTRVTVQTKLNKSLQSRSHWTRTDG